MRFVLLQLKVVSVYKFVGRIDVFLANQCVCIVIVSYFVGSCSTASIANLRAKTGPVRGHVFLLPFSSKISPKPLIFSASYPDDIQQQSLLKHAVPSKVLYA